MLPPPTCVTVGVVFLGLKVSPSLLKTYCCSFWPNNLLFVPSDHRVFLKKVFFPLHVISSKLQSSFELLCPEQQQPLMWMHTWLWALTPVFQQLLVHCRLPFCFFLFDSRPSWPIFSQQQVCVIFLIVAVTQLYVYIFAAIWMQALTDRGMDKRFLQFK